MVHSAPIPESPNCVDVLLDDSGSQGPPPGWHPCLGGPAIGLRVVLQHQVYGCPARVPPKHVQFATGHPCRGVIECDRQGLHELPAVSRECIGFNRIGLAAVATEASDHIHLPLEGSDTDLLAGFLQASPSKPGCLRNPIGSWHLSRASTSSTAASYKDAQAGTQHCMQRLLRHKAPPRPCEAEKRGITLAGVSPRVQRTRDFPHPVSRGGTDHACGLTRSILRCSDCPI